MPPLIITPAPRDPRPPVDREALFRFLAGLLVFGLLVFVVALSAGWLS